MSNDRGVWRPPARLVFVRDARVHATLAACVAERAARPPLDREHLAARAMLAAPPRTPWMGIGARLEDGRDAVVATPERRDGANAVHLRSAIEALLDRVLAGVRRVAVLSGGGLDSSVLLAHAVRWAERSGGSAFGVALDFASPGDDRPHRRALEAHLRCAILTVRPEEASPRLAALLDGVDAAPLPWPSAAMEIEAMARARAEGAECVLTGVGADELFDGDPHALAELPLARGIVAARELAGFERPRRPVWTWALRPRLVARVPRVLRRARALRGVEHGGGAPAWAGPRWLELAAARRREAALVATSGCPPEPVPDGHRLHVAWLRHAESVAAGIPRVDPFLDSSFVAEVTSWPRSVLLDGGMRRGLFRAAAEDLVPESLRTRIDKATFEPALDRFLDASGDVRARLERLARAERVAAAGIVDARAFHDAAADFLARRDEGWGWSTVWPVLAVEAFVRSQEGRV